MKLIKRTLNQIESPIDNVFKLKNKYNGAQNILDLTQGVVNYPPDYQIIQSIIKITPNLKSWLYTERQGQKELRSLVAEDISELYGGNVSECDVLITSGCNNAFCLAISALSDIGDEIILSSPYYFNHDMWIKLDRLTPVYLDTAPSFLPNPEKTERLITCKTRAIALVTPGNPTGNVIPPEVLLSFLELARKYNIMLVLDETYKIFRSSPHSPHLLFEQYDWREYVISLHSFSKEFAIPGSRVGFSIAHPSLIKEMMKLSDCLSISAPTLGQEAAKTALLKSKQWRRNKAGEILERKSYFDDIFHKKPGGFDLISSGAFYGWVKHSQIGVPIEKIVQVLCMEYGILVLPGTIFYPRDDGYLRFSFASLSINEIRELETRLKGFHLK